MNDERAVEVMAEALHDEFCDESECDDDLDGFARWKSFASKGLAALRAEGYDLYRPDDCDQIKVMQSSYARDKAYVEPFRMNAAPGIYRLVPVGGDS